MLVIRNAQLPVLVAPRLKLLHAWLHPHLRKHFGASLVGLDDAALQALIVSIVAQAIERGANQTRNICHFVYLRVLFGADFESLPWAVDVLTSTNPREPEEQIEALYARGRAVFGATGGAR